MTSRSEPSMVTYDDGSYLRVPTNPAWYHDSYVSQITKCQNGGYPYFMHEAFARVRITTNAPNIQIESVNDTLLVGGTDIGFSSTGLMLNGAAVGDGAFVSQVGGASTLTTYSGLPGGTNTLDLVEGPRSNLGFGLLPHGNPIIAFRIPDGYTYAVVMPSAPAKRIVVYGDSITVGQAVTAGPNASPCYQSWPMLMRANAPGGSGANAGAHVLVDASGYGQITDLVGSTALVNDWLYRLTKQCDGGTSSYVVVDLGTNDYGNGQLASTVGTNLGSALDTIHTSLPNVKFLLSSPRTRSGESTPNGAGSTMADFRTAISTVQSTRSSFVTYIDGSTLVTFNATNFWTDNLHMKTPGHAAFEAAIRSTIGY